MLGGDGRGGGGAEGGDLVRVRDGEELARGALEEEDDALVRGQRRTVPRVHRYHLAADESWGLVVG